MTAPDSYTHRSVMMEEVLEALPIQPDGVYVDCTFGRGGHAEAILRRLGEYGRLIALDKDPDAIQVAMERLARDRRFIIHQGSFAMLEGCVRSAGLSGKVDGVLLDLGVSSPQLDAPERGFSFLRDGPLDMRMDPSRGESAAQWLARATEEEIAGVLHTFGEERHARRIARAIIAARGQSPIATTGQLARVVAEAHPAWEAGKHPATQTFQAIRIYLNRELEELETCLPGAVNVLARGGRLAVISFHSLEDRIVKRFMRREARGGDFPPGVPVPASAYKPRLRVIGKARHPGADEVAANPRARSAVLRVAERL